MAFLCDLVFFFFLHFICKLFRPWFRLDAPIDRHKTFLFWRLARPKRKGKKNVCAPGSFPTFFYISSRGGTHRWHWFIRENDILLAAHDDFHVDAQRMNDDLLLLPNHFHWAAFDGESLHYLQSEWRGNSSQFAMSEHDALERVSCDKWIPPWNIFHHKKFTPPRDFNGFFLLNSRILPDKKKKGINSLPAADVCASIV